MPKIFSPFANFASQISEKVVKMFFVSPHGLKGTHLSGRLPAEATCLPSFRAFELKNPLVATILAVLLVGYGDHAICDAEVANSVSVSSEDPNVEAVAHVLVNELNAQRIEVRDNAATALKAMGTNAANALADYINNNLKNVTQIQGITKATTVLAKIGKDVADDAKVRDALVSAADVNVRDGDWPRFQLKLAAIDALGEINKYRGGILPEESSSPGSGEENSSGPIDLSKETDAADKLSEIAEQVFNKSTGISVPTPILAARGEDQFYANLKTLRDSQSKLIKLAAPLTSVDSPSKDKELPFSKLTKPKTLAASLKKIEGAYLDSTKAIDLQKLKLENASDQTASQFQTESAYDLLIETAQLKQQVRALAKATSTFEEKQSKLKALLTKLANISEGSKSELVKAAIASALDRIFSKPPKKKPAAEAAKQDQTKKEERNKDSEKKADDTKATDKKDSDKKDPDKKDADSSEVEEDETANE